MRVEQFDSQATCGRWYVYMEHMCKRNINNQRYTKFVYIIIQSGLYLTTHKSEVFELSFKEGDNSNIESANFANFVKTFRNWCVRLMANNAPVFYALSQNSLFVRSKESNFCGCTSCSMTQRFENSLSMHWVDNLLMRFYSLMGSGLRFVSHQLEATPNFQSIHSLFQGYLCRWKRVFPTR